MNRFMFLGLWLLNVAFTHAQDIAFIPYGQNEGLRHSQVLDISQDHNGNLWLGTATRSIYRFDGVRFHEYKIEPAAYTGTLYTFAVQVDSKGTVWIVSNLGLIRFNGETSTVVPTAGNLTLGINTSLFISNTDQPWVVDQAGQVFVLETDSLKHLSHVNDDLLGPVTGLFTNADGKPVFFNTNGNAIHLNPTGNLEKGGIPGGLTGIQAVHVYKRQYYVASQKEIVVFNSNGTEHHRIPLTDAPGKITKLVTDEKDRIWYVQGNKLFVILPGSAPQPVSGSAALVQNDVVTLFKDKDGGVWISVDVLGILKFHKRPWQKIAGTAGKDITSMLSMPDGTLCFGTYRHGLIQGSKTILEGMPITSMALKQNKLLIGTLREGAMLMEGKNIVNVLQKPNYLDVHGVSFAGDSLMLGTSHGFFISHNGQITKLQKPGESIGYSLPMKVNDTIYLTGSTSGILKVVGDSLTAIGPEFLKTSTVYTMRKQLSGRIAVTGEFSQVIWFDSAFHYLQTTDLRDIASNILLFEELDPEHWLVGSNDGLFKVTIENNRLSSFRKYSRVDGFGEEELYVGASIYKPGKALYVGTVNGAYEFFLDEEEQPTGTPTTYLTDVAFQSTQPVDRSGYFRLPLNLQLAHNENSVTFAFASASLSNPHNVLYQYRLEGLEDDWTQLGTAQQVTYTNLPPGTFEFNVQAVNENHIFGNIAKYTFVVRPALWQTAWFYAITGFLLVLLILVTIWVAAAYKIRVHKRDERLRMEEATRIRKQMSMDFHDEMGNKLASMLAQASLQKVKHKGTSLESVFDLFERNAFTIFHGTKDFIWTIDVRSNRLLEVIAYLRDFGYSFFDRNGVTFHVEENILDERFDKILPDGFNRQIILIFKEAMTNALKHSGCQNVYFSVELEATRLNITFRDDGSLKTDSPPGNGLKNMQNRAKKIGATFTLQRHQATSMTNARLQLSLNPNKS